MSYSDFDKFDNSMEKMLDTEKRRYNSPFSYFDEVDANKVTELEGPHDKNDMWLDIDGWTGQEKNVTRPRTWIGSMKQHLEKDDRVNSPSHYTRGKVEAIDIIEDAIQDAPSVAEGMLQGQVLKYMLRVWLKDNPTEDLKKAQWYLSRLIEKQEEEQ